MKEPREFSLQEANALVPMLHRLISRQMLLQNEIEDNLKQLHLLLGSLPREISLRDDDPPTVREAKEHLLGLLQHFEEGWSEVQQLGCVVKDPRTGLVDFYSRVGNEFVWLCWRFGEEAITHFHGLDEGFPNRRALPEATQRHRLLS